MTQNLIMECAYFLLIFQDFTEHDSFLFFSFSYPYADLHTGLQYIMYKNEQGGQKVYIFSNDSLGIWESVLWDLFARCILLEGPSIEENSIRPLLPVLKRLDKRYPLSLAHEWYRLYILCPTKMIGLLVTKRERRPSTLRSSIDQDWSVRQTHIQRKCESSTKSVSLEEGGY